MNFDVVFSHLLPSSCFVLLKWPKWRSCFTCLSENRIMFAHNFKAEQFYFFNSNAWLSHTKERCIQEEYCVCNFNICFYGFSCKCSTAAKDEIRDFFFSILLSFGKNECPINIVDVIFNVFHLSRNTF